MLAAMLPARHQSHRGRQLLIGSAPDCGLGLTQLSSRPLPARRQSQRLCLALALTLARQQRPEARKTPGATLLEELMLRRQSD